ncbi:predicted protein [Histoplasma mississippiense (nom. inval.)]|uniref:predicted protein n=1 Tax=Ajellomyces capsulatus (strain NAm1 / WU24) TaxID=2059318 RepID=UPI000157C824|nr:predicted protein [Histoplasma mississippiense (nom. inval.)]EDN09594.1 predicted protein [Histoplasma mississippiense (nom. inval.)]
MKAFYSFALLIAAALVSAAPADKPAGKLVPKGEVTGGREYIYYIVPSAEDDGAY